MKTTPQNHKQFGKQENQTRKQNRKKKKKIPWHCSSYHCPGPPERERRFPERGRWFPEGAPPAYNGLVVDETLLVLERCRIGGEWSINDAGRGERGGEQVYVKEEELVNEEDEGRVSQDDVDPGGEGVLNKDNLGG